MKNWRKKLIYLLAAASLLLNFYLSEKVFNFKRVEGKYLVEKVIDGDSFVIDLDRTIRLADLDAPALDLCLGKEAKQRLEELILSKYVSVEVVGQDAYKRTLGLVFIPGEDRSVNEIILAQGMAKYYSGRSREGEKLQQVAEDAKEEAVGVWSDLCYQYENKENPQCNIKGNHTKHDRRRVYHLPNCSEYKRTAVELDLGEQWFCTEKEAQAAGYRKSEHCF